MNRDRDDGGIIGYIIRHIIIAFIHQYISLILTLTTIELYQYLYQNGYGRISRFLIILLINGALVAISISAFVLIMKIFNISLGSNYYSRYY